MASMVVHPASRVRGHITIPGDKSISHRYALLAAMADGITTISGYAPGADCASTLSCLASLGVVVSGPTGTPDVPPDQRVVTVTGRGLGGLQASSNPLDAGNSGTTLRLLAGILAGHPFDSVITGDASLRGRPMRRIIDPLSQMGATLHGPDDRPPLTIRGAALHGIHYTPPVASAQVKSAVLLAGLHASGDTVVSEPQLTRDHTEKALPLFGVELIHDHGEIRLRPGQRLRATSVRVPGDASSAACWAVAAAALPGSDITLDAVGLNPTRTGFLSILERAGAQIDIAHDAAMGDEPIGRLRVRHGEMAAIEIGPDEVPGAIDELPLLAAFATHGGALRVTGASELRHKESDRIAALATGLRGLGGHVEELEDGFEVLGDKPLSGGTADAAGDHRLAMAFAIAAIGAQAPSHIHHADVVDVSYPGFFDILARISVR
ncbi:MAG: 3-phosphoshikimate 1-carboxyvinyltransferase [Acidobacteria bacterium]|nr:3-phosphoshikimate 1-carboxyvinyltransferase [Acidobacteriota bacterium]